MQHGISRGIASQPERYVYVSTHQRVLQKALADMDYYYYKAHADIFISGDKGGSLYILLYV